MNNLVYQAVTEMLAKNTKISSLIIKEVGPTVGLHTFEYWHR